MRQIENLDTHTRHEYALLLGFLIVEKYGGAMKNEARREFYQAFGIARQMYHDHNEPEQEPSFAWNASPSEVREVTYAEYRRLCAKHDIRLSEYVPENFLGDCEDYTQEPPPYFDEHEE